MLLFGTASWVVMYGSLLGFASIMNGPPARRRAMMVLMGSLLVASAVAAVLTLGSGALLAVGTFRGSTARAAGMSLRTLAVTPPIGAVFLLGIALTIGAAMLLTRAAHGPDWNQ